MRAKAFSPAHITGFFKAELGEKEANQLGSLGAGFSIQKGVKTTVNVRPKTKHDITNYGIRIKGFNTGDIRVSEYVLNQFLVDGKYFDVTHEIDVPVGYGFGCSAAVALSLSIALNDSLQCGYTKKKVAQISHAAEIKCRTGPGAEFSCYHGDYEIRTQ